MFSFIFHLLKRLSKMEKWRFNIEELAEYIAVSKGTIYNWISQRKLIFVKMGRRVKFDIKDIDKWIESKKIINNMEKIITK
ncbi:MAG TPA: transcriptional regulator [Elusimicrobia bacterium]|nr:transcriptional regulator [Elusimicrobiota bacterium]